MSLSEKLNLKYGSVPGDITLCFQPRDCMYHLISDFID